MTDDLARSVTATRFDRRGLFRVGGLTLGAAALVAACGQSEAGTLGRIGDGVPTPTLPDPIVSDGVYLRTAASIETSIATAYQHMLKAGALGKASSTFPSLGDQSALVKAYAATHTKAAETYNSMAREAGSDPWTCGNAHLDSVFLTPIFDRVEKGAAATDTAKQIDPSDDPTRDMINLVYVLESLSAAAAQSLVPQITRPAHRSSTMTIGVRSARQAALVALRINPGGYVTGADSKAAQAGTATTSTAAASTTAPPTTTAAGGAAPPQTEIPLPVAVASMFGSLAPITYIGGHGDENGVRLKLNFETPSLNSWEYPYSSCTTGA